MVAARLEKGVSDPVSFQCTCPARDQDGGVVLLFYRYFANNPVLPPNVVIDNNRISQLATWQKELTRDLKILGKIRIAAEGFNITIGGTKSAVERYIAACTDHWSFQNLPLANEAERKAFFKPSIGCACAFHPAIEASVRVCAEITPLGITNYTPSRWDLVEELSPTEFHRRCHDDKVTLLDLRNYYESRIGHFVNPQNGDIALKPQIRRFSQLPKYFDTHQEQILGAGTQDQILTYCTGGIRCEKATRWMAERKDPERTQRIATLKGGIAAYLDWVSGEISAGRMTTQQSLFKGRNYVFDGRGALSLDDSLEAPVSQCHVCGTANDRLSKCRSIGCHLVLVVCTSCESADPRCCSTCHDRSPGNDISPKTKEMCLCEKTREAELWGAGRIKHQKIQKSREPRPKPQSMPA